MAVDQSSAAAVEVLQALLATHCGSLCSISGSILSHSGQAGFPPEPPINQRPPKHTHMQTQTDIRQTSYLAADHGADAQLAGRVDAVLVGDHGIRQHLGSLRAGQGGAGRGAAAGHDGQRQGQGGVKDTGRKRLEERPCLE